MHSMELQAKIWDYIMIYELEKLMAHSFGN
jgi:hypothetical protein